MTIAPERPPALDFASLDVQDADPPRRRISDRQRKYVPLTYGRVLAMLDAYRRNRPEMSDADFQAAKYDCLSFMVQRKAQRRRERATYYGGACDIDSENIPGSATNVIECSQCGHTETWEDGNYAGERTDFTHHDCGSPGRYVMCAPDCAHTFPGCASVQERPRHKAHNTTRPNIRVDWNAIDRRDSESHRAEPT